MIPKCDPSRFINPDSVLIIWKNSADFASNVALAIVSKGDGYICYTYLSFWHCNGEEFHCCVVLQLSIYGVACRRLIVKELNHEQSKLELLQTLFATQLIFGVSLKSGRRKLYILAC